MNWGYRIIIVYIVFIITMMGMVYVSSKQTNEMQTENYYVEELKYQEVIDGKNNLAKLPEKVSLTEEQGGVRVKLPAAATNHMREGKIYFLRPSAQKYDISLTLTVDENNEQLIPKSKLLKGFYSVKLSWKAGGKLYFSEQALKLHL